MARREGFRDRGNRLHRVARGRSACATEATTWWCLRAALRRLPACDAEVVEGDLGDADAIRRGMEGCQAAFHIAADYRVGMDPSKQDSMRDSNVGGTERVLDAAADAGVERIVYVSTINVFGNTNGRTVEESYSRNEADGFVSTYDETKYRAHRLAEERAAKGAPVVIVQPGCGSGPGDHALIGQMIKQASAGKMPAKAFPRVGLNMVHVDMWRTASCWRTTRGSLASRTCSGGEITTQGGSSTGPRRSAGRSRRNPDGPAAAAQGDDPREPVRRRAHGLPPNFRR